MKIFLDDVRKPYDNTWVLVRSYDEFVNLIENSPNTVTHLSLDHDLGMDEDVVAKTGMDVAKYFVDYAITNTEVGSKLEEIYVHSSNPPGRKNITGLFISAKKHHIFSINLKVQ